MTDKPLLQDVFLDLICAENISVSIFLKSGIQLKGLIKNFDRFVIMLEGNETMQMVYRHAISTILPGQKIDLPNLDSDE